MKRVYSQKRKHLLDELERHFAGEFEIKGHAAGLHVRVHFYNVTFTEELVEKIYASHVKVYPVEKFALENFGLHTHEILLGYAHLSLAEMTEGIKVISAVINDNKTSLL